MKLIRKSTLILDFSKSSLLYKVLIAAATLTLVACSSAPELKYPLGTTARKSVNAIPTNSLVKPQIEVLPVVATKNESDPPLATAMIFTVNDSEKNVLPVLRRWARVQKVDFSWNSRIDYAVSNNIRQIQSESFETAINQMRDALNGVAQPLDIKLDGSGLSISMRQIENEAVSLSDIALEKSISLVSPAPVLAPTISAPTTVVRDTPARSGVTAAFGLDAPAGAAAGALPATWLVGDSKSLRSVIEGWASTAGIRVDWTSPNDYEVTNAVRTATFAGTLKEALGQLAANFGTLPTPLGMKFQNNGQILRVYDLPPNLPS